MTRIYSNKLLKIQRNTPQEVNSKATTSHSHVDHILNLQQTIGNQATIQLLREQANPDNKDSTFTFVQRTPDSDSKVGRLIRLYERKGLDEVQEERSEKQAKITKAMRVASQDPKGSRKVKHLLKLRAKQKQLGKQFEKMADDNDNMREERSKRAKDRGLKHPPDQEDPQENALRQKLKELKRVIQNLESGILKEYGEN